MTAATAAIASELAPSLGTPSTPGASSSLPPSTQGQSGGESAAAPALAVPIAPVPMIQSGGASAVASASKLPSATGVPAAKTRARTHAHASRPEPVPAGTSPPPSADSPTVPVLAAAVPSGTTPPSASTASAKAGADEDGDELPTPSTSAAAATPLTGSAASATTVVTPAATLTAALAAANTVSEAVPAQLPAATPKSSTSSGADASATGVAAASPTGAPSSAPSSTLTAPATSTAAVERFIASPVSSHEWGRAVAAQVHVLAANGVKEATLRLSPEHLGPVEVHIDIQDSKVNVNFTAAHAETRIALEQTVPQLRDMLAGSGLSLGQANVQQEARSGSHNVVPRAQPASTETTEEQPIITTLGLVDEYA